MPIVDAVFQAELAHSGQLIFGGRSSVHFDAENLSDLHGCSTDSAGDGVNQDARTRVIDQTGLPVGEVGGEEIYGESGGLFGGPIFRDGPDEVAMRHGFFGEGGPLPVAHHAPPGGVVTGKFATGEFAAGDERRLGSAGVSAVRGHQVGKVQATRLHLHQKLLRCGVRGGDARLSTSRRGSIVAINVAINDAGTTRKAASRSPASASIMMTEFPTPVA